MDDRNHNHHLHRGLTASQGTTHMYDIKLSLTPQELRIIAIQMSNTFISPASGKARKDFEGTPAAALTERIMEIDRMVNPNGIISGLNA